MAQSTIFHGTSDEQSALLEAFERNCDCTYAENGARSTCCAPHRALVEEQRFLDGLLFERWRAGQMLVEEHSNGRPWEPRLPYRWRGELQQ